MSDESDLIEENTKNISKMWAVVKYVPDYFRHLAICERCSTNTSTGTAIYRNMSPIMMTAVIIIIDNIIIIVVVIVTSALIC